MRKFVLLILFMSLVQNVNGREFQEDGLKCAEANIFTLTVASHPWTVVDGGKRTGLIKGTIVSVINNPSVNTNNVLYVITETSTTIPSISTNVAFGEIIAGSSERVLVIDSTSWIWLNSRGVFSQDVYGAECSQD